MFFVMPQRAQSQEVHPQEVQPLVEPPLVEQHQDPRDKKTKDYPAVIGIGVIAVYAVYIACMVIMRPKGPDPLVMMRDIYIAEVHYQGGGYRDKDTDCVGEYGLLSELLSYRKYAKYNSFLDELTTEDANGYYKNGSWRYAVYVPATDASKVIKFRADDVPLDEYTINHNTQERDFFIVAQNINDSTCLIADGSGHVRKATGNIKEDMLKIINLDYDHRGDGAFEKKLVSRY